MEVSKEGELKPSAYTTRVSDSTALVTINIHEPVYQPGQACRPTLSSSQLLSQIATSELKMADAQWLIGNPVTCELLTLNMVKSSYLAVKI